MFAKVKKRNTYKAEQGVVYFLLKDKEKML